MTAAIRGAATAMILGLVAAACAGASTATTGASDATVTTSPPTTQTTVEESTTTAPPEATTTSISEPTDRTAVLEDGRPATFMAVTDDYEAVEVDTASGRVIRSFGQRATAAELISADEIAPNVVDGVWRTVSGETVMVSECCEPAGGHIAFLKEGEHLDRDYEIEASQGWWVVPSAHSDLVIITGYYTEVVDATDTPTATTRVTLFENDGSGVGAIGWSLDGSAIFWLDEGAGELTAWNRTDDGFSLDSSIPIDWIGSNQHVLGLGMQSTGNLVSFLTTFGSDGQPVDTEGVVYSTASGEVLARFPVPAGSAYGGYDPSGRFLLYTTLDGQVTYQGLGREGVLGDGYLFASW